MTGQEWDVWGPRMEPYATELTEDQARKALQKLLDAFGEDAPYYAENMRTGEIMEEVG